MFEASQQFFPTPANIAAQMRAKLKSLRSSSSSREPILDPSAGKGDLLEHCYDQKFGIEIDPDLQAILREKGITVIGSDFLSWDDPLKFGAILMNPPFNRGVDHVLKAWETLENNGAMVALLNAESLNNPHTKERSRLAELICQFGGWEDLGPCFKDAERPTNVAIAMVWLKKPKRIIDPSEFQFTGNFKAASKEVFEEFSANPLAPSDAIDGLVAQYRACVNILKAQKQVQEELHYHLSSIGRIHRGDDTLSNSRDFFKDIEDLKYRCWWGVFRLSKMSEISTSDFRQKFDEFAKQQVKMEFCKENILMALEMFFQNREQIMVDSVVSVFDRATQYHESNITHREGWKSNSGWKLNPKIVIPSGVSLCQYFGSWSLGYGSTGRRFLEDLDEVLSWVAGEEYNPNDCTASKIENSKIPANQWMEQKYYDIKLFKKGTVHIRFRDLYLLDDFNAIAAKGKQWLGGAGF